MILKNINFLRRGDTLRILMLSIPIGLTLYNRIGDLADQDILVIKSVGHLGRIFTIKGVDFHYRSQPFLSQTVQVSNP